MAGNTTSQHFVPCCYLANFGIEGNQGRVSIVYAYDVHKKTIRQGTVESFAFSNNFYDIDDVDNSKLIESFYKHVEDDYGKILQQVLMLQNNKTISQEQKNKFSAHFAFQLVRTKSYRDRYKEFLNQLRIIIPPFQMNSILEEYGGDKALFKNAHIKEILSFNSANLIANMLLDRKWIIWRNKTDIPFYTSDNPVCVIYHKDGPISIIAPEVEIYIPLSPTMAISVYHKGINDKIGDKSVAEIRDSRIINGFNGHIAKNCSRFVFSNKGTFDSFIIGE